jgi:hypothetical protein
MSECCNGNPRWRKKHLVTAMLGVLVVCLFFQSACKRGPTEPGIKNPREYQWTTDTLRLNALNYPGPWQILLRSSWGASGDLYCVGHSDGTAGGMWHFDGNGWNNVRLATFEGGTIPAAFILTAVHGLNANNIYAVGQRLGPTIFGRSFVIHFDGSQWSEQETPGGNRLNSVWVNATDDVWACGWSGTLLHYDGVKWNMDSVDVAARPGFQFTLASVVTLPTGKSYMLGYAYDLGGITTAWTYYFFGREGTQWKLLDTFVRGLGGGPGKWGGELLSVLPSGAMYSIDGYGVFRWDGAQWVKRYEHSSLLEGVFGTDDNNLFVVGQHGLLANWNGNDWFVYAGMYQPQNDIIFSGGWADEHQAIVLGWVDGISTFVLRGR